MKTSAARARGLRRTAGSENPPNPPFSKGEFKYLTCTQFENDYPKFLYYPIPKAKQGGGKPRGSGFFGLALMILLTM
jgi:hypothetical protein